MHLGGSGEQDFATSSLAASRSCCLLRNCTDMLPLQMTMVSNQHMLDSNIKSATILATCRLQARLAQVSSQHSRVWQDLLSMHMLAYDFIFPRAPTLAGNIRRTQSPNTGLQLELSHPHVLGHRLFNIMDVDSDGVIGWRDLCEFTVAHIRTGSLDWRALWDNMTGKPHDGQMLRVEEEGRLVNWQAGQCWGMLTEAFAPDSNSPDWKVSCRF